MPVQLSIAAAVLLLCPAVPRRRNGCRRPAGSGHTFCKSFKFPSIGKGVPALPCGHRRRSRGTDDPVSPNPRARKLRAVPARARHWRTEQDWLAEVGWYWESQLRRALINVN
jgi:hypothetical protein